MLAHQIVGVWWRGSLSSRERKFRSAIGAVFPGPSPPSRRFRLAYGRLSSSYCCRILSPCDRPSHPDRSRAKHSQSSPRWAHPSREDHPQAGPRGCLMRRHQHLLTTPLLLAPVPQGLKMHTHRCILRSRLLKFVQALYSPNAIASLVTGSIIHHDPRTRTFAIGVLTALRSVFSVLTIFRQPTNCKHVVLYSDLSRQQCLLQQVCRCLAAWPQRGHRERHPPFLNLGRVASYL